MFLKTIILFSLIFVVKATAKDINCHKLLGEFANAQELFIRCITMHSVPVTMCITCSDKHTDVLKFYDILLANCSSVYFDNDRINLVASTQTMLTDLWVKAYCDDCFNNNNSLVFDDKNTTFYECIDGALKDEKCEKCKVQYLDLNTFYINLDQHNNGEVCFDLQDSMNRTRNMWSKQLNCCKREYNMTLFTIALCLMSSLPIIFYASSYFITKYQERRYSVLYDDEPTYNLNGSSTTNRLNINNINNPPLSLNTPTASSSSTTVAAGNNEISKATKPLTKNDFNIDNNILDSSDEDDVDPHPALHHNKEKLK